MASVVLRSCVATVDEDELSLTRDRHYNRRHSTFRPVDPRFPSAVAEPIRTTRLVAVVLVDAVAAAELASGGADGGG